LERKPERKRPLGMGRRKWGIILKQIFRKLVVESMDWIDLAQDRVMWRAFPNAFP
jgi:hypothetical protein